MGDAVHFVEINDAVKIRARALVDKGLRPLDALHLASAETAEAVYLCTCDDNFLKRSRSLEDLKTKLITPIDLISEIEK